MADERRKSWGDNRSTGRRQSTAPHQETDNSKGVVANTKEISRKSYQEIPDPVTAEWQTKDAKARPIIGLQVADNQLHLIRKQTTAKGSWKTLKKYHEKATLSSKVNLLKRLCGLKLTEHGDMENHIAKMQNLIDQLASLGEPLAEHLSVALFLSSLPDSYGTLITALETRPEEDLTTELVKGKILEEFKRRSNVFPMQNELESKVLKMTKTEVKPKPPLTCFFCKKPRKERMP